MTLRVMPYGLAAVILLGIALAAVTEQRSRYQLTLVTHELRVALDSLSQGFHIVAARTSHTDSVAMATNALVHEKIMPRQAARARTVSALEADVTRLHAQLAAQDTQLAHERAKVAALQRKVGLVK